MCILQLLHLPWIRDKAANCFFHRLDFHISISSRLRAVVEQGGRAGRELDVEFRVADALFAGRDV